jgi:GH25 family lysozyme M1 (1,4-beta-N-acetylmuramidase)
MKAALTVSALSAAAVNAAVQGFDISHYQSSVNFPAARASGASFVIIKVRRHHFTRAPCPIEQELC